MLNRLHKREVWEQLEMDVQYSTYKLRRPQKGTDGLN